MEAVWRELKVDRGIATPRKSILGYTRASNIDWGVVVDDCSDLSRFSTNFGGAGYQKNRDGAQSILPSNLVGFATHKFWR